MLKLKGSYGKVGNDDIGGQRRWVYESTIVGTGDQGWWFGQSGNQGGAGIRVGEIENLYASGKRLPNSIWVWNSLCSIR
jgi:hypothetical protein